MQILFGSSKYQSIFPGITNGEAVGPAQSLQSQVEEKKPTALQSAIAANSKKN